jgi:hypothetical protein
MSINKTPSTTVKRAYKKPNTSNSSAASVSTQGAGKTQTVVIPGIEEVKASADLFLSPLNPSISTFDGFFGEKPNHVSLLWSVCEAFHREFLSSSIDLYGARSKPALLKTIQDLMELLEFGTLNTAQKNILKKAAPYLYTELECREAISNHNLASHLSGYAFE